MTRPKRPRDPNQLAKLIADIATGDAEDVSNPDKDEGAAALGRKGGAKRAQNLTPERRKEIAQKAAAKRWSR